MPSYLVHVCWTLDAEIEIDAESEDDAFTKVLQSPELPDGSYMDNSFEILDIEEVSEDGRR